MAELANIRNPARKRFFDPSPRNLSAAFHPSRSGRVEAAASVRAWSGAGLIRAIVGRVGTGPRDPRYKLISNEVGNLGQTGPAILFFPIGGTFSRRAGYSRYTAEPGIPGMTRAPRASGESSCRNDRRPAQYLDKLPGDGMVRRSWSRGRLIFSEAMPVLILWEIG